MKFKDLVPHLKSSPGAAGVTRVAWRGETHLTICVNDLYFVVGDSTFKYAFNFDDLMADDWEPC